MLMLSRTGPGHNPEPHPGLPHGGAGILVLEPAPAAPQGRISGEPGANVDST